MGAGDRSYTPVLTFDKAAGINAFYLETDPNGVVEGGAGAICLTPGGPLRCTGGTVWVPIGGGAGAGGSFVYRPGEPAPSGNVYADFNLLYVDLIAIAGDRTILYDNDLVAPLACSVPPKAGGGPYNFKDVYHTGSTNGEGAFPFTVPVQFEDGVTVENFGSGTFFVGFESLSNTPIVTIAAGVNIIIADYGTSFLASGTAPFFQVDAGFLLLVGQAGANFQTGASALVDIAPGAAYQMSLFNASRLGNDVISGAVGSSAAVLYDATGDGVTLTQTGMLGALTFSLYDFAERVGFTDNTGWVPPAPTTVQAAIDRLKTWSDSILSWSTPIDGTVEAPAQFDRSLSIDPDTLREGDVLHLLVGGEYTVVTNPAVDVASVSVNFGSFGTLNSSLGPVSPGQFIMKADLTFSSVGAAGTFFIFQEADFGIILSASYIPQQTGPHAIDTTVPSAITVEGNWGAGTPDANEMVLKTLQASITHRLAG